ncbi:MAG: restriction endonuclease subunit S [Ignavibacteria bacterium]|nr:restriction endonuclease subunit S [Ignavibacteria bacterium]
MKSAWRTARIDKLGKVVTGKTPPTVRVDYFDGPYPFITPSDLGFDDRHIKTERTLSEVGCDYQRSLLLPEGTVCFVCIGATIGKTCLTDKASFTNQQINSIVVQERDHDRAFIYYLLRTKEKEVRSIAAGAATPIVNKSSFSAVEVKVPDLETQRRIASILSTYDDLIENNTHRIKILEEMAKLIYREWFVEFNAPGVKLHKATAEEKKVTGKDAFPESWEAKELGEFLELAYGKGLKADTRREGRVPVYGSGGIVGHHDEALVKGPGIVVGRKGNVGSVFWSETDFFPIDTVFYVRSNVSLFYCYYCLKNQTFINTDAAVPGLSRESALRKKALLPNQSALARFETIVRPMFRELALLNNANRNLRSTRDLLLPKLVSGEVEV